ncbi:hypothetical protein HAP48_0043110 [Bradyrhizobium septentrionale]|uniref:Uncharacterized protein n=1 Tax=Bradyrhizobium septentrionale TaxID=1404411 RepID=A0A974A3P2_9BRAD|nr:hypothetical protein [Bradyrhizobium septentrionale]UGY15249.1 hypothetical protein HAP48_0043110 [Bradyrhizobium septentrionale]UGY23832.1 hypothetical protein HU675_0038775 [Bradyrhizobium septentrionale]
MTTIIDNDDIRVRTLEAFAGVAGPAPSNLPATQPQSFLPPVDRVHGAQQVAVRRHEPDVLRKIKELAAAAGEYFYYRFPVKNKGKTEYIEGPTIKCANAVARLFGNCDVDCRSVDIGTHWVFHARFMDLETGYSLTRPLQQRKTQATVRGDAGRAEDIAYQIGTSKAIRNVVTNALDTFTTFAWQEAKMSVVETVGKQIEKYKTRVQIRLDEMEVDLHRVEAVRGRPLKDWLATDVARTIAEIQAVNDGMATADETWPKKDDQKADGDGKLSQFASDANKADGNAETVDPKTGEVTDGVASTNNSAQGDQPAQGSQTAEDGPQPSASATEDGAAASETAASSANSEPEGPATEAEYSDYAVAWFAEANNVEEVRARWAREKSMRAKAGVKPDTLTKLEGLMKDTVARIKKG